MNKYPKYPNDTLSGPLPDLFTFADGTPVHMPGDWPRRRREILDTAVELEFGGLPPKPEVFRVEQLNDPAARTPRAYRLTVGTAERTMTFVMQAYLPARQGRFPVLLTGDGCYRKCNDRVLDTAMDRGYAVVIFNRTEMAHDMYNENRTGGVYDVYPDGHFSAISAWAWGYHRCVDALEQLPWADTDHIAVTGHSRGGKTALLAGATDERIRLTDPNGSGAHGCGCYRYHQYDPGAKPDERNEELADLMRAVPYWLGKGMRAYIGRETELPHDMHFIKALVAPRILLETSGRGDVWANPRGSWLTFRAAKRVWEALGVPENCASVYREGGHDHTYGEFCALLDRMDADIRGEAVPERFFENAYPGLGEDL